MRYNNEEKDKRCLAKAGTPRAGHNVTNGSEVPLMLTTLSTPPFNGLFTSTTWVSWHLKGLINLDFDEARDDGTAMASAGTYTNLLHLAPDRHHATTSSLDFYRPDALPDTQPTV